MLDVFKTLTNGILEKAKTFKGDWSENDSSSPNYIKNRICYVTDPVDYVLLEEQAIIFDDTLSYSDDTITLETGDGLTYVVTFDNTVYECLLTDIGDGNVYIGNGSLNSDECQDTGEPFYVSSYVSECGMNILTSTVGEHSISIIKRVNDVVKIDEKFLPATVGKDVSGQAFTEVWDGTEYVEMTADIGAEIFNDYEHNIAIGYYSHAEGDSTKAFGYSSHAEGDMTVASGRSSHAEGDYTKASGDFSHAEGSSTEASGNSSHSEGYLTVAIGYCSHAEGNSTTASGDSSHSEGDLTVASGDYSHSEGYYTKASSDYQHVQGKYNIEDTANTYAHIVGNGDDATPSNAHTLDWDGNAWYQGDVYVGGTSQTDASKLATESFVQAKTTLTITQDATNTLASTADTQNWAEQTEYHPNQEMCFTRIFCTTSGDMTADTAYAIGTLADTSYAPGYTTPLNVMCGKQIQAYIGSTGTIYIKPYEATYGTIPVRLSGFWFK